MDREEKSHRVGNPAERELLLQWGKRLRCVRGKRSNVSSKLSGGVRRRTASRAISASLSQPQSNGFDRQCRLSETQEFTSPLNDGGEKKGGGDVDGELVWPRLCISLSNKEKEEDFLAIKGCKPPYRPKKRLKLSQRNLLLFPGAWLSDLGQDRYEVRERKTPKKRPKGLKSMGAMESDSE